MQVDFYQLGRSPIERVLPRIAERVIADGGRLLVVSADAAQLGALDACLWADPPEGFLPHARAADVGDDAEQSILLSERVDPRNGARTIALVDGRWREEALAFDRALHFFDDATLADARTAWRGLADREGIERNFWRQGEDGRWEKVT